MSKLQNFLAFALVLLLYTGQAKADDGPSTNIKGEIAHVADPSKFYKFYKWAGMLERHATSQFVSQCFDRGCAALKTWQKIVLSFGGEDPLTQLKYVNGYVNGYPYRADDTSKDYWATPREFLVEGGDCEDYAITKYWSLRLLGWPKESLRIKVVRDLRRQLGHAVLAVSLDGKTLLLDNLNGEVEDQREAKNYIPIYSINEIGVEIGKTN